MQLLRVIKSICCSGMHPKLLHMGKLAHLWIRILHDVQDGATCHERCDHVQVLVRHKRSVQRQHIWVVVALHGLRLRYNFLLPMPTGRACCWLRHTKLCKQL